MKCKVPERWTEYSAVGSRIPGTRFIAFKVPLQELFDKHLAPWERFTPSDLVSKIEKRNEELGLVVDLTYTDHYYSPEELPANIEYVKIFTAGREVPSNEVIREFKCVINDFLSRNPDNEKLVGVHCTHGLNRTGYMLCRYMIDVLGMVPSEAIEKFNQSRGHCIERQNYLDDLLQGVPRNHQSASPRWGPQLSETPFSWLPGQRVPTPQHHFPMGGRPPGFSCFNPDVRIPPPAYMPGPGPHPPHMADRPPHMADRPPRMADRPPRMADRPPRMADRPPRMADRPPRMADRPPRMAYCPPPMADRPPRMADHPPHMADRPPRMADRPPRMADRPPPMADRPPRMADRPLHHLSGGAQRPHPPRHLAPHQHYGPPNGHPAWDFVPSSSNNAYSANARGAGPRVHRRYSPYGRSPEQGCQSTPRQHWQ